MMLRLFWASQIKNLSGRGFLFPVETREAGDSPAREEGNDDYDHPADESGLPGPHQRNHQTGFHLPQRVESAIAQLEDAHDSTAHGLGRLELKDGVSCRSPYGIRCAHDQKQK